MSDLSLVLGSLLSSLAHARRIADEETASIAEYYRSQPLLEGLSLPRVRVPELVVDLPLIIEQQSAGTPEEFEKTNLIKKSVSARLITAAQTEGVKLPKTVKDRFESQLDEAFAEAGISDEKGSFAREDVVRAVDRAFYSALRDDRIERLTQDQMKAVSEALLMEAAEVSLKRPRTPPSLKVTVQTGAIKEKSNPASVTRVKLILREEGLEWESTKDDDGTVRHFLTPE